ncbi:hypothetical protein ACTJKP_26885, partial [Brucella sp. 22210]
MTITVECPNCGDAVDFQAAPMTIPEQAEQAVQAVQRELSVTIYEWERRREFLNVSPTLLQEFMRIKADDLTASILTAAAPHLAAVRVKKLEWTYTERVAMTYVTSDDRGMLYYINQSFGSDSYYFATVRYSDGTVLYDGDDLPSAKAAAQADYEARILSALEPSVCKTCNGRGIIGGMYRVGDGDVDGWEEPCPDCSPSAGRAAVLEEALRKMVALYESEYDADVPFKRPDWLVSALHPVADKPDEAAVLEE